MSESDAGWYYSEHGQQAGPVTADALRQMASSGRLRPQDLVWRDGMGNWQPAGAMAELAGAFSGATKAPPPLPPRSAGPPAWGQPPAVAPQPRPGSGVDPAMRWLVPIDRSGWAIAAGYLGLFSFFGGFLGPVAIAVSIFAIRDIRKHPERHGMGRAVFGLIAGILGTMILVILLVAILSESGRRY
jgi:hypothetical protein